MAIKVDVSKVKIPVEPPAGNIKKIEKKYLEAVKALDAAFEKAKVAGMYDIDRKANNVRDVCQMVDTYDRPYDRLVEVDGEGKVIAPGVVFSPNLISTTWAFLNKCKRILAGANFTATTGNIRTEIESVNISAVPTLDESCAKNKKSTKCQKSRKVANAEFTKAYNRLQNLGERYSSDIYDICPEFKGKISTKKAGEHTDDFSDQTLVSGAFKDLTECKKKIKAAVGGGASLPEKPKTMEERVTDMEISTVEPFPPSDVKGFANWMRIQVAKNKAETIDGLLKKWEVETVTSEAELAKRIFIIEQMGDKDKAMEAYDSLRRELVGNKTTVTIETARVGTAYLRIGDDDKVSGFVAIEGTAEMELGQGYSVGVSTGVLVDYKVQSFDGGKGDLSADPKDGPRAFVPTKIESFLKKTYDTVKKDGDEDKKSYGRIIVGACDQDPRKEPYGNSTQTSPAKYYGQNETNVCFGFDGEHFFTYGVKFYWHATYNPRTDVNTDLVAIANGAKPLPEDTTVDTLAGLEAEVIKRQTLFVQVQFSPKWPKEGEETNRVGIAGGGLTEIIEDILSAGYQANYYNLGEGVSSFGLMGNLALTIAENVSVTLFATYYKQLDKDRDFKNPKGKSSSQPQGNEVVAAGAMLMIGPLGLSLFSDLNRVADPREEARRIYGANVTVDMCKLFPKKWEACKWILGGK